MNPFRGEPPHYIIPSRVCVMCVPVRPLPLSRQPLLLKDNFFHTPLLLERNGIEPVLKYVFCVVQ